MPGNYIMHEDTQKVGGSISHNVHPWLKITDQERMDAGIESNKVVDNWSELLAKNEYCNIETFPEHYSGDWKNAETLNHISGHPHLYGDGRNFEITVPLAAVIFWKDDSDGIEVEKHIGRGDISLQNTDSEIKFVWNNKQYFISPTTEITLIGGAKEYLSKLSHGSEIRSGDIRINNRSYDASSFTSDDAVYYEFIEYLNKGNISKYLTDIFAGIRNKAIAGV